MGIKQRISVEEALVVGEQLGINWTKVDIEQFRRGLEVELEHGAHNPEHKTTNDTLLRMGKAAWKHLQDIGDYYTWLEEHKTLGKNSR